MAIAGSSEGVFHFRPAEEADQPVLQELVFAVLREYGIQPDPRGTDADLGAIHETYRRPGGVFDVVADAQGEIVGCYGIYVIEDEICELRKMYLRPDFRGMGLGRRMLIRALSQAKNLGFLVMQLETASCLREAISLYEKFGFRQVTTHNNVSRCDRVYNLSLVDQGESPAKSELRGT